LDPEPETSFEKHDGCIEMDNSAAERAIKIAFISPLIPDLIPMTTLARKLQLRNHDVVLVCRTVSLRFALLA
jgi:hypothetical protein